MARIVIIGGGGHVGTYLVPALVDRGHTVVNVSRGNAAPYRPHPAWNAIEQVFVDRDADEAAGMFGARIAELDADIVIDMISFELGQAQQLVNALHEKVEHYLFCSSIWVYGHGVTVPTTELEPPNPIDTYGANKAKIEAWLLQQARRNGFPATCFRPGHIVGEGWVPINPLGNANPGVYSLIARGEELVLPNLGLEMLYHVHADDVAQWIICAIEHRAASIGEGIQHRLRTSSHATGLCRSNVSLVPARTSTLLCALRAVEARSGEKRRRILLGTHYAEFVRFHREEPAAPWIQSPILQP